MGEENSAASSGLFAVFVLSIYSLVLIPYTIYRLCNASDEVTTQPVVKSKKQPGFADRLKGLCTKQNIILLGMWVFWCGMVYYSQSSIADMKPFDPFEILGVPRDATDRDIAKAYRKLSLIYHPDKNPDPKAHAYFASYISKAYAALTDEVSRQNYEKYGHPDGHQGMNLGVALPEWMFTKDSKAAPLMLLVLVGGGILLPMALMSWYMLSSSKFTGPNQIMNDTLGIFWHPKYGVKESQSLVRIPDTLLMAMEFLTLYTPSEHNQPLDDLRKLVTPCYPDILSRSNKTFWQRKASILKVHMLMLAHLERLGDEVPTQLQADLKYFRTKAPQFWRRWSRLQPSHATRGTPWAG
jgi:translocation protein SEC63